MAKHPSIKVMKGVSIYKRDNSKYYTASISTNVPKKYHRVSTGCDNIRDAKISAIEIAQKYFLNGVPVQSKAIPVPKENQIKYLAHCLLKSMPDILPNGKKNYSKVDANYIIGKKDDGISDWFDSKDITTLKKRDISDWLDEMDSNRDDPLANNSKNKYMVTLKKIVNYAIDQDILENNITFPSLKKDQTPRPAFTDNEIGDILQAGFKYSGKSLGNVKIDKTFYLINHFIYLSFIRPTVGELFAVKFKDFEVYTKKGHKYVKLRVDGKTGIRTTYCKPATHDILNALIDNFKIIHKRDHSPDDYIFMPDMKDRGSVAYKYRDMFNAIIEHLNIRYDSEDRKRSVYSMRHSAIQHILSMKGTNIYDLAKNAGTSVQMIEQYYARFMGLSEENVQNLFEGTHEILLTSDE